MDSLFAILDTSSQPLSVDPLPVSIFVCHAVHNSQTYLVVVSLVIAHLIANHIIMGRLSLLCCLLAISLLSASLSSSSSATFPTHSFAPRDCKTSTIDVSPLRSLNDLYYHHNGAILWFHPCGPVTFCDCPVDSLLCLVNKTTSHIASLVDYSPDSTHFDLWTDASTKSSYNVTDGVPCTDSGTSGGSGSSGGLNRTLSVYFGCAAGSSVAENVTRVVVDDKSCQYSVWIDTPYACVNKSNETKSPSVLSRGRPRGTQHLSSLAAAALQQ